MRRTLFVLSRSLFTAAMVGVAAATLQAQTPAQTPAQTSPPAPILTLDEAVRLALENSRPVKIAQLDVDKAALDLATLKSRRKPEFDTKSLAGTLVGPFTLTFAAGSLGTYPNTGPLPGQDTTIGHNGGLSVLFFGQVSQPLTQLRTIGYGAHALSVGEDIAREQVRAQEQGVRNHVESIYFGLLQAGSAQRAGRQTADLYREMDRLVSDYVARQVALPADALAVKALIAKQDLTDLTVGNTIASLKEQLNLLMGRSVDTDFSVEAGPADTRFDVSLPSAEAQAVDARSDVRQARLRVQQAEADLQRTHAAALPEVSAVFQFIGLYNVPVLPPAIAVVGVYGTWEPWDWGRRKREAETKTKTIDEARLALRETEDAVRLDVRQRYRKAEETRAMLDVADIGQQTAREKLRVATDRYRVEATLQREMLQAQASLADADQQYEQALAAFWTARADFEKAVGGTDR